MGRNQTRQGRFPTTQRWSKNIKIRTHMLTASKLPRHYSVIDSSDFPWVFYFFLNFDFYYGKKIGTDSNKNELQALLFFCNLLLFIIHTTHGEGRIYLFVFQCFEPVLVPIKYFTKCFDPQMKMFYIYSQWDSHSIGECLWNERRSRLNGPIFFGSI